MMKKLLLALAIASLAIGSASAFSVGDSVILETRDSAGNINPCWTPLLGSVWAASAGKSTAPGLTGQGCMYASTYRSVAGLKESQWLADLPVWGVYEVFVTTRYVATNMNPILYRVISADGVTEMDVNQLDTGNVWYSLGTYTFLAGAGTGAVQVSNAHIDKSGNMWADGVKFTLLQEIPEPGSLLVLSTGLCGLVGLIRRRRA